MLLYLTEIGSRDEGGAEGTETGELEEQALLSGRIGCGRTVALQLHVELSLVALLAYHPAAESLELSHDDLYLFAYLVLLLHDGHHVLRSAGGNDEVLHLPVGNSERRVLAELVLFEVVIVVGDDERQLGDEPLVLSRSCAEQRALSAGAICEECCFSLRQVGEDQVGQEFLDS